MSEAIRQATNEARELAASLREALAACQARKALERRYERERKKTEDRAINWIAFVGGRIFNDYSKEGGDRPGTGPNERDPGSGGVLEPGDPGYGGDVLQPGDPGYGGGD